MGNHAPLPKLLKQDLFGRIELVHFSPAGQHQQLAIRRDLSVSKWWLRPIARALLRREVRALKVASQSGLAPKQLPRIILSEHNQLLRSYLDGQPLHIGEAPPSHFFCQLKELLSKLHESGVCHNDLAKEPNVLVLTDGSPALIDFQLATVKRKYSPFFKLRCREDLRHVLKHQRNYQPKTLTADELHILATKSIPAKIWMRCFKPLYLFVTRRMLNWRDREGAGDRGGN